MVQVQEPMGHVDPVHHEVGEDAAAEVPEPAPVSKAIFVERLIRRGGAAAAYERRPVDRLWIDTLRTASHATGVIPVPCEMNLVHGADAARLEHFVCLLNVRH